MSGGSVVQDRFHFFLFHSFPFLPPSIFPSLLSFPILPFFPCLWHMFASMQKCVRLWRPEQDTSYMLVSLSTWSLTVLVILTRLAAWLVFRVHWSRSPMLVFTWVLRIWIQALMTAEQGLLPTETFPQPRETFFILIWVLFVPMNAEIKSQWPEHLRLVYFNNIEIVVSSRAQCQTIQFDQPSSRRYSIPILKHFIKCKGV